MEAEVESIYDAIKVSHALERRLEETLQREIAHREEHRAEATRFAAKRLGQLARERDKLLQAYYAEAVSVEILKREQRRIDEETAELEGKLQGATMQLQEAKRIIGLALKLAGDCRKSYRRASPTTRKLWNEAFLKAVRVRDGRVVHYELAEPFRAFVGGSNKDVLVEVNGFEPSTSALRTQRSTN
jgi:site-specific DNA recombinase